MSEEYAEVFLRKMRACRPVTFLGKLDETQKGMGFVLAYLDEAEHEIVAGDLAREMNVSTARIAALLKKMEKSDLVRRSESARDGRKTVVTLTETGQCYASRQKEAIRELIGILVKKVGKDDLETFVRISREIQAVLEE